MRNPLNSLLFFFLFSFACPANGQEADTNNKEAEYFTCKEKINKETRLNLENANKLSKLTNDLYADGLLTPTQVLETTINICEKIDSQYMFEDNSLAVACKDYAKSIVVSDIFIKDIPLVDKTADSELAVAKIYYAKGDKEKAYTKLEQSLSLESNNCKKSELLNKFSFVVEDCKEAIKYANRAILEDPNNGMAYIALGKAYMNMEMCGDDIVSKKSVYWLATDKFLKAKQQDKNVVDFANSAIRACTKHYPSQSDAFYLDIVNGQKYKVNCNNIDEETIVRTIKL